MNTHARPPLGPRSQAPGVAHALRALALVAAMLLLAGCTGTFEVRPPTLLVVAFEDSAPAVGLVRDTFSALQPGETRTLTFVPGSRRPLPAQAVDVDVVDRAGARTHAVFLLRDPETQTAYLHGFSTGDIDPENPAAFAPDPAFVFLVANGGTDGNEGLLESDAPAAYCPTSLQVSSDGRYAALFEERSACGAAEFRAIYVLDLQAAATSASGAVVARLDAPAPASAGIFLDQDGALDPGRREMLWFVDPVGLIRRYDLATGAVDALDATGVPTGGDALRDIGRVQDFLVLVGDESYSYAEPRESAPAFQTVTSATGLTGLVLDPFAVTDEAVLVAGDRLVLHDDVTSDLFEVETSAPTRTAATLEPIDRFVYLLGDARIGVFDLLEVAEGVRVVEFPVPEIPSGDAITWTRARAAAPD